MSTYIIRPRHELTVICMWCNQKAKAVYSKVQATCGEVKCQIKHRKYGTESRDAIRDGRASKWRTL